MPVADDDVLRDHANCILGAVHAGFPLSHAGGGSIEEPIAPDPQSAAGLSQMVVQGLHLARQQFRLVPAFAALAIVLAEQEDFVHAGVKGIRPGDLRQFVDQVENDLMHFGVQRAITAAVDPAVLRVLAGRFIQFRMRTQ